MVKSTVLEMKIVRMMAPFFGSKILVLCSPLMQGNQSVLPRSTVQKYMSAGYFFFSAFHTLREMARPQNGQKLMG
jgi:hypothetical protein